MTSTWTRPDNDTWHAEEAPSGPEVRRKRRRVRLRLTLPVWVALSTSVLLLVYTSALAATYGAATNDAVLDEAAEAHRQWVEAGKEMLAGQTAASADVLKRTFTAGREQPAGSQELLHTLLAANLAEDNNLVPFQLVGVATADGGYTGVGISPSAGQIGVAAAGEGTLRFRPWDGGVLTEIAEWNATERDWYVAGVTSPDTVHFVGPSMGLDGKPQIVAVMAEPAVTGKVWMASMPVERVARLIKVVFPASERFYSATAMVPDLHDNRSEDGVELVSVSEGMPHHVARRAATALGERNEHTSIVTDEDGDRWRVTVGRVFPGNSSVAWVLGSPEEPAVGIYVARYVLMAVIAGGVVVAIATVLAWKPRRSLQRITDQHRSFADIEPSTFEQERITEVAELGAAAAEGAAAARAASKLAAARAAKLERLHVRHTQRDRDARRAAARDLHDGPLQTVIAAGLTLPPGSIEAQYLTTAQVEMRRVADELVADELGPGGLPARLAQVAAEISDGRNFAATVESPDVVDVSPAAGEVLIRAARELLMNAKKHSGAASATAHLAATDTVVRLTVTDDGVGFSGGRASDPEIEGGFGLFSLRVQVEQIGGSLAMAGDAAGGAKVVVSVPPHPAKEHLDA